MYEHRRQPPISRAAFRLRLALHAAFAVAAALGCLAVGMAGYLIFESDCIKTWRDAFLNAAMLLGDMGPIHTPQTDGGKVFAGLYALFAGIVFVAAAGVIIAPLLHRLLDILDMLHYDDRGDES
jgi:hypothetical protein